MKETFLAERKATYAQAQEKLGGEDPFNRFLGFKIALMGCFKPHLFDLSIKNVKAKILPC